MRIRSFHVKGLLGQFDHEINFKTKDRITIIHGPNGVGKTTVLRLLESIIELRLSYIYSCIFKTLQVKFVGGGTLEIFKNLLKDTKKPRNSLHFRYTKGNTKEEWIPKPDTDAYKRERRFPLSAIEDFLPQFERIESSTWVDTSTNEIFDLEEIFERFEHLLPFPTLRSDLQNGLKRYLNRFRLGIFKLKDYKSGT